MDGIPNTLAYLLMFWGAITAVLVVLVIYGNALSTREDQTRPRGSKPDESTEGNH
jgi:hypothetical protein